FKITYFIMQKKSKLHVEKKIDGNISKWCWR
ncbi:hypothetical protein I141_11699, partial [Pasteurella multocida P1933]